MDIQRKKEDSKNSEPRQYQTFSGNDNGISNSDRKLKKLGLPNDLQGKSVLDIGCNEGFFSFECEKRGAKTVVGIERKESFFKMALERKKQFSSNVEFLKLDWNEIPTLNYKFDIIIFLAAFHYAKGKQSSLLNDILEKMNRGGMLILELGLSDKNEGTFFIESIQRKPNSGYTEYPNLFTIEKLLSDAGFEQIKNIGRGGIGKPVRFVIHAIKP